MDYWKVYVTLRDDPKWLGLSDKAKVAYIEAGCWVAHHETDGLLAPGLISPKVLPELIASGLVDETEVGMVIHGWGNRQVTKAALDAKRIAARNAARIRWGNPERNAVSNAEVEVQVEGEEETTKAELRSVPGNPHQPTHDQLYLARKLDELALKPAVIVNLNKRFGMVEVIEVLRSVADMGVTPDNWVAYLTGILNARREAM